MSAVLPDGFTEPFSTRPKAAKPNSPGPAHQITPPMFSYSSIQPSSMVLAELIITMIFLNSSLSRSSKAVSRLVNSR